MYTIEEWFEKLPQPYRSKAIKNTKLQMLQEKHESFDVALKNAFKWSESIQGFDYWQCIHENFKGIL